VCVFSYPDLSLLGAWRLPLLRFSFYCYCTVSTLNSRSFSLVVACVVLFAVGLSVRTLPELYRDSADAADALEWNLCDAPAKLNTTFSMSLLIDQSFALLGSPPSLPPSMMATLVKHHPLASHLSPRLPQCGTLNHDVHHRLLAPHSHLSSSAKRRILAFVASQE
jgi:hypothetical protein